MSTNAVEALKKTLKKKTTDRFEIGAVIRWTAAGNFTYVAVKTKAGWFTSARTGNYFVDSKFESYEDLVDVLARSEVSDIEVATAWEAI